MRSAGTMLTITNTWVMGKMHYYTLVIFIILVSMTGCSHSPKIQADLNKNIEMLIADQIKSMHGTDESMPGLKSNEVTFAQAIQRVIRNNPEIMVHGVLNEKGQIDVRQAKTGLWPRMFLELSGEVPINSDGDTGDDKYSYGLVLRYDLTQAIFYKDAVAVSELKLRQAAEHKAKLVKKLYNELILLLCEMDYETRKKDCLEAALIIAEKALKSASRLGVSTSDDLKRLRELESNVNQYSRLIKTNRLVLKRLNEKLSHMMGLQYGSNITITDTQQYLPGYSGSDISAPVTATVLRQVWNHNNDIEIEKNNLFLAEMKILEAKRRRLPRVNASVGFGDMHLDMDDDFAAIIPRLSVSVPLFDFGDIRRLIEKREKERDIVKIRLLSKLRKMAGELSDATLNLQLAWEAIQAAEKDLSREKKNVQEQKSLFDAKRADLLEYYNARLTASERKTSYLTAVFEFRKAIAEIRQLRGDSLPADLAKNL